MKNFLNPLILFCLLTFLILFSCTKPEETAETIVPQPIPPGYDFPANRAALQAVVDANDVTAMRTHGWNIWAGLTADSKSEYQGEILPIWETWLSTAEVFTDPPTEHPAEMKKPARMFAKPSQFFHTGFGDSEADNFLVGFNKFSPEMVDYLWAGQPGPGNQEYFYTSISSMNTLNANWPDTTSIADRKVQDAPVTALELKPVLMLVKADTITAIPLWRGPNASTDTACAGISIAALRNPRGMGATDCHPTPNTWTHCVLINPQDTTSTSLSPATQSQFDSAIHEQAPACTEVENAFYSGINMIYHFKMDSTEAVDFNQNQNPPIKAAAGDFAVLVAMHVNSKELIDWTWQTFWWQGGLNPPEDFPGSFAGITDNVKGVWRNYAMCTAYSQTMSPNNQGQMRVCFNPFLETSPGIPDGIRSNCVSCHGTARIPTPSGNAAYPPDYGEPVNFGGKRYFADSTKTDLSWAIPFNSH